MLNNPLKINKVLIIGSSGFIGSRLIKKIKASDKNKVMALLHKNFNFADFEDFDVIISSLANVNLEHFKRFEPDVIFHLGRLKGNGNFGRLVAAYKGKYANNRMIKYLSKNNLNPRVFYFSGTLVYGNQCSEIADEKSIISPTSFSKEYHLAETPWYEESLNSSANISMLRLPWVVGKGSWFHHHYIKIALEHGFVPLYSNGKNWMSLIDVHDCCSLILELSNHSKIFKIINLYNPNLIVRQNEFVEIISEVLNTPVKKVSLRNKIFGDNAFNEAMRFSLKVKSIHTNLYNNYNFKINDLETLVRQNMK